MLDADTKRRIDTARDILVGKVPDPKSQVEQITIALIYKFMDDLDAQSEEWGGERTFFAGDFIRYGWAKLMAPGLGGYETLNLYAEAITRMPENPGIPPLFRDIFNNAYLPYRDPETLRAFLKIIDEFTYDHSERLGDAFEYLLSVLGAQGDAGQFRTPRHIIDFIVEIIDPKKDEVILDPACGTAGFLISAYKHTLAANTDAYGQSTLTPDERGRLASGFMGYDISPDMVRLSLVNMYLHGFPQPSIHEYDTLTSEDRWNDFADVILANPPFMSPRGGIRPHNRFSVQSRRSEVLFVDYMAEHLTPTGRAGFIVPEGIIFQSQNAYKQLRKMLVEEYLVAVISLPAGVFNPYSGVKTSILILDKTLAGKTDSVAFFKVENDGYDLGAQRRPIEQNDLPSIARAVREHLDSVSSTKGTKVHEDTALYDTASGGTPLIVSKYEIADSEDYNLSGDRYRVALTVSQVWPMVNLGSCVEVLDKFRRPITKNDRVSGPYPYYGATGVLDHVESYIFDEPLVLVGEDGAKWGKGEPSAYAISGKTWVNNHAHVLRPDRNKVIDDYLIAVLIHANLMNFVTGVTVPKLNQRRLREIQIPLPPLEVQREIVAEIGGYQKVIDGAQTVTDNYRPHIATDPDWPTVEIGEYCEVKSGGTPKRSIDTYWNGRIPWVGSRVCKNTEVTEPDEFITEKGLQNSSAKVFQEYTTLIALVGATIGKTGFLKFDCTTNQNVAGLFPKDIDTLDPHYLFFAAQMLYPEFLKLGEGKFRMANLTFVRQQKIPLPPLETQQAIVAEIQAEQSLVSANHQLIHRMENKIQSTISRVWQTSKNP